MITFASIRLFPLLLVSCFVLAEAKAARVDDAGDPGPAQPDVVLAWNEALTRYAASAHDGQPCSGATAFLLALMHGAMREGIEVASGERGSATNDAYPAATGAAAAHATLSTLLPAHGVVWDRLLADSLAAIPDDTTRARAMTLGTRVASSWRERHGYAGAAAAASLALIEPTPQWIHSTQPFALKRADQIRAASPNLNRVVHERLRREGQTTLVEYQSATSAARAADRDFWGGPPEYIWNRVARVWSARRSVGVRQRARMFAVLNAAMADGYLAAFESRQYYRDGGWYVLLGPAAIAFGAKTSRAEIRVEAAVEDYPSVPAVISGVATEILQSFCGGDVQSLVFVSPRPSASAARRYARISTAAEAYALAGEPTDHDEFAAGPAGYQQGRKIGRWIARRASLR